MQVGKNSSSVGIYSLELLRKGCWLLRNAAHYLSCVLCVIFIHRPGFWQHHLTVVLIDLESMSAQEAHPSLKRQKLAHQSSTVNISVNKPGASASGGSVANATQVSAASGAAIKQ